MYRRDYVLRLIERLGMALIALRNRLLQRKGDLPLAMAELGDIAGEVLAPDRLRRSESVRRR